MKTTLTTAEVANLAEHLKLNQLNVVEAVTPVNVAEAKAHFIDEAIQHRFPNIEFQYDIDKLKSCTVRNSAIERARHRILDNLSPENETDKAIYNILGHRFKQLDAANRIITGITNQSNDQTAAAVRDLYGTVDDSEFYEAVRCPLKPSPNSIFLSDNERAALQNISLNALDIAKYFCGALDYCGLKKWDVEISDQYSSIDARDINLTGHPILGIPSDRRVSGLKLVSLIGHEINCHIRNVENSRAWFTDNLDEDSPLLPLVPFLSKSFSEKNYEGIAKLSDYQTTGEVPTSDYLMTIALAQHVDSWSQVASYNYRRAIAAGKSREQAANSAWIHTYRVLRGASDTAHTNGYAFTKDAGYLLGFKRMRELRKINSLYPEYASLSEFDTTSLLTADAQAAPHFRDHNPAVWAAHQLLSNTR